MRPLLVLIAGPPGSEKTTLARLVGQRLNVPVISQDEFADGLALSAGVQHRGSEVFDALYESLDLVTGRGMSVVAEGAFTARQASELRRFSDTTRLRAVRCETPIAACPERFAERAARRPGGPDALDENGLKLVDSGEFPWHQFTHFDVGAPTLGVDLADGCDPALETIIGFVSR